MTNEGALKVWWVPQVPMKPFEVEVSDLLQASFLLDALAQYDLFQLEHNIKPDYCNAGGLEIFEEGEWVEWWDNEGDDFDAVRRDPDGLTQANAKYLAAKGIFHGA